MSNKNTYWLASYPKSGNTWFRLFLNQLLGPAQQLNINDLPIQNTIASARLGFDVGLGVNSSDLLPAEIDRLRPFNDELFNDASDSHIYRKIHDAFISPNTGHPIISTKVSAGVIYIVRNPLDVLVSYHYHLNESIDETMAYLNGQGESKSQHPNGIRSQFNTFMGGWSHHVLSWIGQTQIPVCVIRYEDLLSDPLTHFNKATRFAQIEHTQSELQQAVDSTQFEKLKAQESKVRFAETPSHTSHFFRNGIAGGWREYLTEAQVQKVVSTHSNVMQKLGYLDNQNNLIF
ncbi:sulfotransferase domain-containing protein [Planctobacterium marinum]|uniref:Sulfotransferase n=1 Tax=Planctobacterium marinum TaxID=1631968 RepID=A0AA48HIN7_9ALTE|nr:sulfotransferase [Planctobacterium marinum]